jgi:Zn-dependent M16 (insulinase) family peptidase
LFGSFSDPNVANTYNVYDSVATYLEEFNPNIDEFNSYLIGTIAKVDPPASIYSKIATSDKNLLCNITLERLEKVKSEILSTDINTVKSYASLFRKIAQQSILFTVGNENKIREFDEIKVVKKLI